MIIFSAAVLKHINWPIRVILCFLWLYCSASAELQSPLSPSPEEYAAHQRGILVEAARIERLREKIVSLREQLKSNPADLELNYQLAEAYLETGEFERAKNVSIFLLSIDKGYRTQLLVGRTLWKLEDYSRAEDYLQEAVTLSPTSRGGISWLIICLVDEGKYEEALEYWNTISKSAGDNELLMWKMADTSLKTERFDEAEELYAELTARDTSNPEYLIGLAQALSGLGKHEEAHDVAKKALEKKSGDPRMIRILSVKGPRWQLTPGFFYSRGFFTDPVQDEEYRRSDGTLYLDSPGALDIRLNYSHVHTLGYDGIKYTPGSTDRNRPEERALFFGSGIRYAVEDDWYSLHWTGILDKSSGNGDIIQMHMENEKNGLLIGGGADLSFFRGWSVMHLNMSFGMRFKNSEFRILPVFGRTGGTMAEQRANDKTRYLIRVEYIYETTRNSWRVSGYNGRRWMYPEPDGIRVWNRDQLFTNGAEISVMSNRGNGVMPEISLRYDRGVQISGTNHEFHVFSSMMGWSVSF